MLDAAGCWGDRVHVETNRERALSVRQPVTLPPPIRQSVRPSTGVFLTLSVDSEFHVETNDFHVEINEIHVEVTKLVVAEWYGRSRRRKQDHLRLQCCFIHRTSKIRLDKVRLEV